jgi:predicted transcriptional regulator
MKLAKVDAQVLVALTESTRGLHVFTVYKRLKFPLGEVLRSVLKLEESGFVSLAESEHASLTQKGKEYSYKIASEVASKSEKPWREVPARYKKRSNEKDLDFYIPKLTLLDKNFFC